MSNGETYEVELERRLGSLTGDIRELTLEIKHHRRETASAFQHADQQLIELKQKVDTTNGRVLKAERDIQGLWNKVGTAAVLATGEVTAASKKQVIGWGGLAAAAVAFVTVALQIAVKVAESRL